MIPILSPVQLNALLDDLTTEELHELAESTERWSAEASARRARGEPDALVAMWFCQRVAGWLTDQRARKRGGGTG